MASLMSGDGRSVYSVAACDPPIMAAAASIAVARCGVLIGGSGDSTKIISIPSARAWSISSCAPFGSDPDPDMISGMAAFWGSSEEDEQATAHRPGLALQFHFKGFSLAPGVCVVTFGRDTHCLPSHRWVSLPSFSPYDPEKHPRPIINLHFTPSGSDSIMSSIRT